MKTFTFVFALFAILAIPCATFAGLQDQKRELDLISAQEFFDTELLPKLRKIASQRPKSSKGKLLNTRKVFMIVNGSVVREVVFETSLEKDGNYSVTHELRSTASELYHISNPRYEASVIKHKTGIYSFRSAEEMPVSWEFLVPSITRATQIVPNFLVTDLFGSDFATFKAGQVDSDTATLSFNCDPNHGANSAKLAEAVITFDLVTGCPRIVDTIFLAASAQDQNFRRVVTEYRWKDVPEFNMFVPMKFDQTSYTGRDILAGKESVELTVSPLESFDRKLCFATYYGLPEPFASKNRSIYWAIGFGGVGILMSLGWWYWKRR